MRTKKQYPHTTFWLSYDTHYKVLFKNLEENRLVRGFRANRSSNNFSALFRQYTEALMRMAMYLTKRQLEHAEDIVQETWIVAIEKLESFKEQSTFKTWLTGILLNKYREHSRRHQDLASLEVASSRQTNGSRPDLSIDMKDAILKLPQGYREILTLHDIEGFKHKEIAAILEINEGTSKSQLFQARKSMRSLLSGYNN